MTAGNTYIRLLKQVNKPLLIAIVLSAIMGFSISLSYKLLVVEIALGVVLICIIFLIKDFTPVLLAIVALRPVVDIWTEYRIDFIGIQMVMTLGIIVSLLFFILTNSDTYKNKQIVKDPVVILFIIYLLINFLSIAVNPKVAVNASLSLVFRFVSFLAMYVWGFLLFRSGRKKDWVLASYIISAAIISVAGYYQLASGTFHTQRGVLAIQGTFSHPNMFANFLILANLACIYFILKKKYIPLNMALLCSNLFLFSQTYSRMSLAVLLLMFFMIAVVYRKQSIYFLPVLIIAVVVIFYNFPHVVEFWTHRLKTIDDPNALISDRSLIFSALIYFFKQNPLIGIGPSTFWPHYFPYATPHNEFLRNLAETGLLGTVPLVLIWLIIYKRFFSFNYLEDTVGYNRQEFIVFLIIISVTIISITSNIGTKPDLLWPLFLLLGGSSGNHDKMDQSQI